MALKSFNELRALDLSQYIQKKPTFYKGADGKMHKTTEDKWLDYIEWAVVLDLLYQNGATKVIFGSEKHENLPNTLLISLRIDDCFYQMNYPIIDGSIIPAQPNQMQIHKAELRGFVKAVAIFTGLGLNLWMKEEKITSEILNENHTITVNIKQLLESALTVDELNNIWRSMTESEQVKYLSVFSKRKQEILG